MLLLLLLGCGDEGGRGDSVTSLMANRKRACDGLILIASLITVLAATQKSLRIERWQHCSARRYSISFIQKLRVMQNPSLRKSLFASSATNSHVLY